MKRRAFTLIELLVVVAIIALLIAILLPSLGKARELSNRSACGANCRGIMQSFNVYAADNGDSYPTVIGPGTAGSYTANASPLIGVSTAIGTYTTADAMVSAMYTTNGPTTQQAGDVMACAWLLVLKNYTSPKQYLCKSDPVGSAVAASLTNTSNSFFNNFNATTAGQQDFTYSYSFAYPWTTAGTISTTTPASQGGWWRNTTDSSLPIMSDMAPQNGSGTNPTAQTPGVTGGATPSNGPKAWNSPNHQRDGQNVGFADGHAEFVRRADIGQNNDDIFTQNGTYGAGGGTTAPPNVGTAVAATGSTIGGAGTYSGGSSAPFDVVMCPTANVSTGQRQ
jgi:prepilin-type N-terminal cleavage/methylation domain-containing protein/prepilin-type processing-associated H-X9-DG protein